MRVFLLFLVPLVLGNPIQEQLDVGSPEDAELLKQMVKDLFSDRDGREIEVDDEDSDGTDISTNLASSESNDEKPAASLVQESDPIEIARFNNYMDAIYRRMNAALRAKLMDPMILNLENKKKSHHKERSERRGARKADHEITKRDAEEDDDEVVEVDRIGEAEEEHEEVGVEVEDQEDGTGRKLAKQKNKAKKKQNKKAKQKTAEHDKKKKNNGKNKAKKSKGKNKGKKSHKGKKSDHEEKKAKKEGRKEKKEKEDETLERSRRNKHSNDKGKGRHNKKSAEEENGGGKTMGSLAGIATLRRSKDVIVMNSESYKVVKSDFTIGPLQLEVSKTVGKGQARSVKTAKAVTEELSGKMVLKVKPDGSAHVKSVFFHKPEKVEVRGSLGNQKKRSDTYLKNSVGKVRPMAAQRILKMARYVLKSPSTVERS